MNLKLSSETWNVRIASAKIVDYIVDYIKKNKQDVSNDVLFDIKLCIEEAVRNAIVHGNKSKKDLMVDISYNIEDNKIKITVQDKGKGFTVSELPNPTHEDNLYKESGRGVYIIHRLMDKVVYNDIGNLVTMEKNLA